MTTLTKRIEAVISGLRVLGDVSPDSFKAALVADLRPAAPGSTLLLLQLTISEGNHHLLNFDI